MTHLRYSMVLATLMLGCGSHDICRNPDVLLTSDSVDMATYELSFKGTSCEIFVPGVSGFEPGTPESVTCDSDNQGSFLVGYLDPGRTDCTPDKIEDDSVRQGTCWGGPLQTRLTWMGPLRPDETLAFTLSGAASRTVELRRTQCNLDPIQVVLSGDD